MRRKKVLFLIIFILIIVFICSCSVEPKKTLPRLVIGIDDNPPFNYFDEDGEPAGINVALAKEACLRMGYEPVFWEMDWDKKDDYLNKGEIDCIWGCFSMRGLEEDYSWVGPYMNARQVVAVLEDSDSYRLSDLEGQRVAVRVGTPPERIFLDRTDEGLPQVEAVCCVTDPNEAVIALRNRYVDACAGYSASIIYYFEKANVKYRFLEKDLTSGKLGVAFSKGDDSRVRQALASALRQMQEDGTTRHILEEYELDADRALGGISIE